MGLDNDSGGNGDSDTVAVEKTPNKELELSPLPNLRLMVWLLWAVAACFGFQFCGTTDLDEITDRLRPQSQADLDEQRD